MERKFLLILVLVGVLVTFFIVLNRDKDDFEEYEEADNSYLTESAGWLKFIDESGEYSVFYPDNWELEDHSYKNEMIRADISREGHTGVQIRMINTRETELAIFSDSYINNFIQEMRDYWQGEIEELSRTYTHLGDNYCCRSEISMTKGNGEKWVFLEYIWLNKGYALAFQCGTKLEKRSEKVPQLDQIASSLSFLK